jgi:hypothetical protein
VGCSQNTRDALYQCIYPRVCFALAEESRGHHRARKVRRLPHARRIPLSRRSHIIGFQCTPGGVTAHESALERDFVTLSSFVDAAATIRSQPVTIVFEDRGCRRRYTPDYLVRDASGVELVEVKYQKDLQANWERLAQPLAPRKSGHRRARLGFALQPNPIFAVRFSKTRSGCCLFERCRLISRRR